MTARKAGSIDALVFLLGWIGLALLLTSDPLVVLPGIAVVLLPATVLVGWRGTVQARRLLAGIATLRQAALDGATWGGVLGLAWWLSSYAAAVLAAGTVFDHLSPALPDFWYALLFTLLPVLLAVLLGAAHGILFLPLNRWLLR